jgi:hypothetical protein
LLGFPPISLPRFLHYALVHSMAGTKVIPQVLYRM